MNPAATATADIAVWPIFRRWLAWHPEWWSLAVSLGAWFFLLTPPGLYGGGAVPACAACLAPTGSTAGLGGWLVMVLAMMLPLMIIPVRATAFGSLWYRRHRAIVSLLGGYLAIWLMADVVYLLFRAMLQKFDATNSRWIIAGVFFIAAGWQLTGQKRRFSVACHRIRPLAPVGWLAHRDCLRFGAELGIDCVGNCGLLMLAAMFSPWHQTMMVTATILLMYERYSVRPKYRSIALAICFMGVLHLIWD